jgi:hypothetical protein
MTSRQTEGLPPWIGDNEWMERWVNGRLDELLPLLRLGHPETEEDAAVWAAKYGDVEPLKKLVEKLHPEWMPYLDFPPRQRRPEPESIDRALEDYELIRGLWQREYSQPNRPRGSVTAEAIAARRNGISETKLRLAMKRDSRRRSIDDKETMPYLSYIRWHLRMLWWGRDDE